MLLSLLTASFGARFACAQIEATPSSATFSNVPAGSSVSQAIQIKNIGSKSISISGTSISGTGFTTSGLTAPFTLAAGSTKSFTLKFSPTQTGNDTGALAFLGAGGGGGGGGAVLLDIKLSGTAISSSHILSASLSKLTFGNELVGDAETLNVTLKNTGNSNVTISHVSVTGIDASVSEGFASATIEPGQTATLAVTFAPKHAESMSGTLTVSSNASNSPILVALSGDGVSSVAHFVALSWDASRSSGVVGYNVYRATVPGSTFIKLVSSPVSGLKYTDGTVEAGKTYSYAVTAVNSSDDESGFSSPITAVIP